MLAGREEHKIRLEELFLRLTVAQVGAHRPAVLIGPRGNGKTVLLDWLGRNARGTDIDTLWITPDEIPTVDALAEKVGTVKPGRLEGVGVSGHVGEIGVGADIRFQNAKRKAPPDLTDIIRKRAQRQPFALLMDEAHTLDAAVGRALLNSAQLAAHDAPFLLALAGTPDLRDVLSGMSATFWGRSRKVGVGLLTDEAVVNAIADPLQWAEIGLDDEGSWDFIIADSQGYPYFVQTWGEELWKQGKMLREATPERSKDGQISLSRADVESAGASVAVEKKDYYADRYEELGRQNLLEPARAVASAFAEAPPQNTFSWEQLAGIVQTEIEPNQKAKDVLQGLSRAGFVWRSPEKDYWIPGIPSLMTYVLEQAAGQDSQPPGTQGAPRGGSRRSSRTMRP